MYFNIQTCRTTWQPYNKELATVSEAAVFVESRKKIVHNLSLSQVKIKEYINNARKQVLHSIVNKQFKTRKSHILLESTALVQTKYDNSRSKTKVKQESGQTRRT